MSNKTVNLLKSYFWKQGGLEKQTLRLARGFSEFGCQVQIITNGPTDNLILPENIRIVNVGKTPKMSAAHIRRFDRLCKNYSADVIFGMERNTGVTHYRAGNGVHAEYLAKRRKVDSFFKSFSFDWNPLHRTILQVEKETYESPTLQKLFTNSHMVKEELLQHYRIDPDKIEVIYNGVEWMEFGNHFQQFKKEERPYHFLFVGNGYQRKGLHYLLEALGGMRKDSFFLSVIGKEKNIEAYQKIAKKCGIADRVKFYGPQNDLIPFYLNADALVIPSLYDPFANVTVEALAMGLYVVSSPFNGGKEVLHKFSGIVIEDLFDRDAMVTALQEALRHPKALASAQKIRESVRHLTFDNQLNRMITSTLQSEI